MYSIDGYFLQYGISPLHLGFYFQFHHECCTESVEVFELISSTLCLLCLTLLSLTFERLPLLLAGSRPLFVFSGMLV